MADNLKIAELPEAQPSEIDFRLGEYVYDLFVGATRRKPGETSEAIARWDDDDVKRMIGAFIREEYYNHAGIFPKLPGKIDRIVARFERAWDRLMEHCEAKVKAMARRRVKDE